jgi:molecular chaperone DnaK (HSP70)
MENLQADWEDATGRFIIFHYFHCGKIVPQVSDSDKTKMEEAIDEKIKWLEENQDADTEDYKTQKKELEDIVQPIIAKLYQGAGGAPTPSSADDDDDLKDEL